MISAATWPGKSDKSVSHGPLLDFTNLGRATLPSDISGARLRCANIFAVKISGREDGKSNAMKIDGRYATQLDVVDWSTPWTGWKRECRELYDRETEADGQDNKESD